MSRLAQLLKDLARVNSRYVRSSAFRTASQIALAETNDPAARNQLDLAELNRAPDAARPYAGLARGSLSLSGIRPRTSGQPAIVLVLPEFAGDRVFAGVSTALGIADSLATRLGRPMRVVSLDSASAGQASVAEDLALLVARPTGSVPLLRRTDLGDARFDTDDIFVATHWTTAFSLQVACRAGIIDPARVVYLVQDYEPGFVPWSTDSALARSTYHAGFHLLVNSTPVGSVLKAEENIVVSSELVFRPDLDIEKLTHILDARRSGRRPQRVLFYGRPSKPRNMFRLGVSALSLASTQVERGAVEWLSAGEPHNSITLAPGAELRSLGTLTWPEYYETLAASDVVLSLQASPHPSHPPLEAAISGAIAVTNRFGTTRDDLHPLLRAVRPDPESLAGALVDALADSEAPRASSALDLSALGVPLDEAVERLAAAVN